VQVSKRRAPVPKVATPRPASAPPRHWLFKTEPETYSIDDLAAAPRRTTSWEGIRNYQARNLLRDEVRAGDLVLVYHSSADPPGVAGVAEVVGAAHPDATQFDARSESHDPAATRDAPRWVAVDVRLQRKFPRLVPLDELRSVPSLAGMDLLRRGNRLSVQPVRPEEFAEIVRRGGLPA
jgi:predicted RNA-binding protein with PUA-like domain